MKQENQDPRESKYADDGLSEKAFKNLLLMFALCAGVFCLGIIIVMNTSRI